MKCAQLNPFGCSQGAIPPDKLRTSLRELHRAGGFTRINTD